MLYLRFTPSMAVQERLEELAKVRERLDPLASLPQPYSGELRRHVLAATVHYSTRIEGNTLSLEQVERLLVGESVRAPTDQIQEAKNYAEAVAYLQSQIMQGNLTVSDDLIRAVHYLVTKSLPGAYRPGQYRTDQNFVVDRISQRRLFFPPPAHEVPELMRELAEWLSSPQPEGMSPLFVAALTHLNFVAIHPFVDGNGRTARLLDTFVMYRGGFTSEELVSLEAYFGRDTQGYYRAIAGALGPRYQPQRDVTVWIDYYLQAHVEEAKATADEMDQMVAQMEAVENAFQDRGVTTQQAMVAWWACYRGLATSRAYQSVLGKSHQTAARDFAKLVRLGLLVRVGKGRSTGYVASEEVRDVFNRAQSTIQIVTA